MSDKLMHKIGQPGFDSYLVRRMHEQGLPASIEATGIRLTPASRVVIALHSAATGFSQQHHLPLKIPKRLSILRMFAPGIEQKYTVLATVFACFSVAISVCFCCKTTKPLPARTNCEAEMRPLTFRADDRPQIGGGGTDWHF